jgi:3-oxoacyl-[acyl-carrier-protein] synthase III
VTSLPLAGLVAAPRRTTHSAIAGLGVHQPQLQESDGGFKTVEPAGVSDRVKGGHGVTTPWLAQGAARAALRSCGIPAGEVQLVLVGTTSPDVLWPSTACLVQTELGLPMCASFDLYAAEAGLLTALAVADRFVRSGTRAALVIGAESQRQLVNLPGQRPPRREASASAVVLTGTTGQEGILATAVGSAPAGGGELDPGREARAAAIDACLEQAGLARDQVDLVLSEDAADPLIALYSAVSEGRVKPGTVVLLLSTGAGGAWAATCLRWGGAPIAEW